MIIWRRTFRGREYPPNSVLEEMRRDVLEIFGQEFDVDEMPCRGTEFNSITLYGEAYDSGLSRVEVKKFVLDSYKRHMTRAGLPCGRGKRKSVVVPFRRTG